MRRSVRSSQCGGHTTCTGADMGYVQQVVECGYVIMDLHTDRHTHAVFHLVQRRLVPGVFERAAWVPVVWCLEWERYKRGGLLLRAKSLDVKCNTVPPPLC